MALVKGSKVNMFYFFTFENGAASKMLFSFRSTPSNLHNNIVSRAKDFLLFNPDFNKSVVVTDLLKRPVVGPFSDFSTFVNGDFCLQSV